MRSAVRCQSNEFRDSAERVADAGGHLLAVKISCSAKRISKSMGKVKLDAINSIKGNRDILDKLRISYDNLHDDGDKVMFCMPCLGMPYALGCVKNWESYKSWSNYCWSCRQKVPHLTLSRLVNKTLVRVHKGKLRMHDLGHGKRGCDEREEPTHVWENATVEKFLKKHQGQETSQSLWGHIAL